MLSGRSVLLVLVLYHGCIAAPLVRDVERPDHSGACWSKEGQWLPGGLQTVDGSCTVRGMRLELVRSAVFLAREGGADCARGLTCRRLSRQVECSPFMCFHWRFTSVHIMAVVAEN